MSSVVIAAVAISPAITAVAIATVVVVIATQKK